MTGRRGRTLITVTCAALLLLALAVVSSLRDDGAAPTTATRSTGSPAAAVPPVIVPGRPGESAMARPAQEVRDAATPRYNSLDVWFVRMMIPHHRQAVEMAALAPDRAADPRIRAIADRVTAAQEPEIGVLRGWLAERSLPEAVAGHDHGTMRGMQPPEAMRQLAAARGADFDRLFVRMMTEHHQGAVAMATDLLKVGADPTLNEFANSVATEQTVEISRLRELTAP